MRLRLCVLRPFVFAVLKKDATANRGGFGLNVDKNATSAYFHFSQNRILEKDNIRFCKPVAPVKVSLRAIFRVRVYPHSTVSMLKKVVLFCAESCGDLAGAAIEFI